MNTLSFEDYRARAVVALVEKDMREFQAGKQPGHMVEVRAFGPFGSAVVIFLSAASGGCIVITEWMPDGFARKHVAPIEAVTFSLHQFIPAADAPPKPAIGFNTI